MSLFIENLEPRRFLSSTRYSGNPILPGYTSDPSIRAFGDHYYLYTSGFGVSTSTDLTHWQYMGPGLNTDTLTWGNGQRSVDAWAPDVVYANRRYYFYFTWNKNIGVAIGKHPGGPFTDALGKPLVAAYNGYAAIDPNVFVDTNGRAYLLYGGGGSGGVVIAPLNRDMVTFAGPAVTLPIQNYLEAPFMFKRGTTYYLTYSSGDWAGPDYNVQYATATSPMGPFTWRGTILQKDATHVGPGSDAVLNVPGTDAWYIVYDRYNTPASRTRMTAIDVLRFNRDGTITPVLMTDRGVAAQKL